MASEIILIDQIEPLILTIRGYKVMLDSDLATLYGVTTKRLNEQVKRNRKRFPDDFLLQLTTAEKTEVVANCDHLARLRFSPNRPYAFTEHGAIMAANVLNSPRAIDVGVYVVRAFVKLREVLTTHKDLARKLDALEEKYDAQFRVVFDAIRQLMAPPPEPTRRGRIGFRRENEE